MTDEYIPDKQDETVGEAGVDETLDTTAGDRDPLSTDDGLAAIAEQMPAVDEDRPVDDETGNAAAFADLDLPGLDLRPDDTDPLADMAEPGDEVA